MVFYTYDFKETYCSSCDRYFYLIQAHVKSLIGMSSIAQDNHRGGPDSKMEFNIDWAAVNIPCEEDRRTLACSNSDTCGQSPHSSCDKSRLQCSNNLDLACSNAMSEMESKRKNSCTHPVLSQDTDNGCHTIDIQGSTKATHSAGVERQSSRKCSDIIDNVKLACSNTSDPLGARKGSIGSKSNEITPVPLEIRRPSTGCGKMLTRRRSSISNRPRKVSIPDHECDQSRQTLLKLSGRLLRLMGDNFAINQPILYGQ